MQEVIMIFDNHCPGCNGQGLKMGSTIHDEVSQPIWDSFIFDDVEDIIAERIRNAIHSPFDAFTYF